MGDNIFIMKGSRKDWSIYKHLFLSGNRDLLVNTDEKKAVCM